MDSRRRMNDLLKQLKVLTPGALVKWNALVSIFDILINKLKEGRNYSRTWVRPWELKDYEIRSTTVHNTIRLLCKLQVLEPLEQLRRKKVPSEIRMSRNGMLMIEKEIKTWEEIFGLTSGYVLERPAIQVLRQRFYELDGLIQGSEEQQPDG